MGWVVRATRGEEGKFDTKARTNSSIIPMLRRMASISKTMPTLLLINENEVIDSIKEENGED